MKEIKSADQVFIVSMILGLSLCMLLGVLIGGRIAERHLDKAWKEKAIKAGVGRYDDKTAEFKFIIVEEIKEVKVDE